MSCLRAAVFSYFLAFTLLVFEVDAQSSARVLIYSATQGFRHDSIPTAIKALQANQSTINAMFDNSEDEADFNDDNLARYDALVFLSTTGEG